MGVPCRIRANRLFVIARWDCRPTGFSFACIYCRQIISTVNSVVDIFLFFIYIYSMPRKQRGRPKKDPAQRKDVDLRIPVTDDQKRIVTNAAVADGKDMAAWARDWL